jgi:hypothetical protein
MLQHESLGEDSCTTSKPSAHEQSYHVSFDLSPSTLQVVTTSDIANYVMSPSLLSTEADLIFWKPHQEIENGFKFRDVL